MITVHRLNVDHGQRYSSLCNIQGRNCLLATDWGLHMGASVLSQNLGSQKRCLIFLHRTLIVCRVIYRLIQCISLTGKACFKYNTVGEMGFVLSGWIKVVRSLRFRSSHLEVITLIPLFPAFKNGSRCLKIGHLYCTLQYCRLYRWEITSRRNHRSSKITGMSAFRNELTRSHLWGTWKDFSRFHYYLHFSRNIWQKVNFCKLCVKIGIVDTNIFVHSKALDPYVLASFLKLRSLSIVSTIPIFASLKIGPLSVQGSLLSFDLGPYFRLSTSISNLGIYRYTAASSILFVIGALRH